MKNDYMYMSEIIQVRVSKFMLEEIKKESKRLGLTMSNYIRYLFAKEVMEDRQMEEDEE